MINSIAQALCDKISKWYGKETTMVTDSQALLQKVAGEESDKDCFPIYAVMMTEPPQVMHAGKTTLSSEGYAINRDIINTFLRAVPCKLTFGIVGLFHSDAQRWDIWQQLTMLLINNPTIDVTIPYAEYTNSKGNKEKRTHTMTIEMMGNTRTVEPEDFGGGLAQGNIYGFEIEIEIPDAYIFDSKQDEEIKIELIETEAVEVGQPL